MFVAAALSHYDAVSTPHIGRTQDSPDESGLCV